MASSSSSSSSSSLNPNKKPSTTTTRPLGDITPRNHHIFDPWNSASTGHQRAENPYSCATAWRQTRTEKLAQQFRGDHTSTNTSNARGGGCAGEWRWVSTEEAKRKELGCEDIRKYLGGVNKGSVSKDCLAMTTRTIREASSSSGQKLTDNNNDNDNDNPPNQTETKNTVPQPQPNPDQKQNQKPRGIFTGLIFYINGSTYPLISDHKLKHLLVENGGNISLALGRRSVTHVILGRPNSVNTTNNYGAGAGAGGGLAAGKLQKEITRVGGKGVKFVGVEWILESLKASKRLPEARFSCMTLHMASSKQPSVYGMFASSSNNDDDDDYGKKG